MSQYTSGNFGEEAPGRSGQAMPDAMMSPLPPPLPPQPIAPPIVAGPLGRPPSRPVWPTPIGIISIVFGASGVLASVYGVAAPWLFSSMSSLTRSMPSTTVQFDPFSAMRNWAISMTVVNGLGVLVAAMLLAGGIGLLQRKPWSATLLFWWAIVRIPLAIALTVVTIGMQQEQMSAMSQQPGAAIPAAFMSGFVWFGSILSIAWYSAYPTFLLIWLTRPIVHAEVKKWDSGAVPPLAPISGMHGTR